MRKILIVITTGFVPYGGLTTVMMNYYRAMDKTSLQIDFASTNEPPKELLDELKANGSHYFNLGNRKKRLPRYLKNLKDVLKNNHYDIIHVNGNSTTMTIELLAAYTAGIKRRIAHVHNTTCDHMALNKLLTPIFKHCYTDACACSQKAGEWMFSNGKYEVLNNAIDLKRYCFDSNQCEKVREQYNILATDKVIGHVGKMVRQKNYEFILDVFEEMLNQVDVCMSGYKCTVKGYKDVQYEATCHPGEKAKAELFPRMLGSIPDKKDSVDMSVCGALCNAELIRIHHLCFPSERVIWR